MKKIELDKLLQILGNLGVLVGILLLVYELDQNRDMMRSQVRHEISQGVIQMLSSRAENSELADMIFKQRNGLPLTDLETQRLDAHYASWFRYIEDVHYQYRNGLYDDTEFEVQKKAWRNQLSIPSVGAQWCSGRDVYSEEFVAELDALATFEC